MRFPIILIKGIIMATVLAWLGNAMAQQGSQNRAQAFARMDGNADGNLVREEFRGPPPAFSKMDANGDGVVSQSEFITFVPGQQIPSVMASPKTSTAPVVQRLFIDVHEHLIGIVGGREDYAGAVQAALTNMDQLGVQIMLLMPPPQVVGQKALYDYDKLAQAILPHQDRFKLLAGGGSLNPMIQEAVKAGKVSPDLEKHFVAEAEKILKMGAVGFGEMTAEHLSFNSHHPYESAPPDHPLFLKLADIAATHGVPIDFHMEVAPIDLTLPSQLKSPPNPKIIKANLAGFEKLLAHNRGAKIIWDHLGWDCLGERTVALMRELFKKHSNLYVSFRVVASGHHNPSQVENRLEDSISKTAKSEWIRLIREFPDHFLMGSDEFFLSNKLSRKTHASTGSTEATIDLINQLPEDLKKKVGYENARRIFRF